MPEQVEFNEVDWFAINLDAQRLTRPDAAEDQRMLMAGYRELYHQHPRILTSTDLRVLEVIVYQPLARHIRDIASAAPRPRWPRK
jgi:hypothetical protein